MLTLCTVAWGSGYRATALLRLLAVSQHMLRLDRASWCMHSKCHRGTGIHLISRAHWNAHLGHLGLAQPGQVKDGTVNVVTVKLQNHVKKTCPTTPDPISKQAQTGNQKKIGTLVSFKRSAVANSTSWRVAFLLVSITSFWALPGVFWREKCCNQRRPKSRS